ncbi:hypothetical protein [Flavobacterium muglaense]|uniref:Uncharacterized protein n=1 Tax=Flavobacterium muglaense TaxID=2764716 RepID=A0A923MYI2_9FLAO|nr:hypothetical protein [Flavobacterium muglaense]MBC5837575.1 hypothetical protein [Flavobacterium muglaense]MBC5844101.1 hypothetical protein [Flavobacterium muglaense]
MKNRNKEITSQIDNALLNVEMNNVTRELLILLKEEIPKAKTKEEQILIGIKLMEAVTTTAVSIASIFQ